jgi:hypothetical protein
LSISGAASLGRLEIFYETLRRFLRFENTVRFIVLCSGDREKRLRAALIIGRTVIPNKAEQETILKRIRTKLVLDVERVIVGRAPDTARSCDLCESQLGLVPVDAAALLLATTSRTLYSWVEQGVIHFSETPEGLLVVCLDSAWAWFRKEKQPGLMKLNELNQG